MIDMFACFCFFVSAFDFSNCLLFCLTHVPQPPDGVSFPSTTCNDLVTTCHDSFIFMENRRKFACYRCGFVNWFSFPLRFPFRSSPGRALPFIEISSSKGVALKPHQKFPPFRSRQVRCAGCRNVHSSVVHSLRTVHTVLLSLRYDVLVPSSPPSTKISQL